MEEKIDMENSVTVESERPGGDRRLTGMDLFSGAGGLSLGAQMAGIDILYAVEADKSAVKTFKRNFK